MAQQGALRCALDLKSLCAAEEKADSLRKEEMRDQQGAAAAPPSSNPLKAPQRETPALSSAYLCGVALARLCLGVNPHSLFRGDGMAQDVAAVLVHVLKEATHELHQFEALMALTNIASLDEDARAAVAGAGAWEECVNLLGHRDGRLVRVAMELMCNIVTDATVLDLLRGPTGRRQAQYLYLFSGATTSMAAARRTSSRESKGKTAGDVVDGVEELDEDDEVDDDDDDDGIDLRTQLAATGALAMAASADLEVALVLARSCRADLEAQAQAAAEEWAGFSALIRRLADRSRPLDEGVRVRVQAAVDAMKQAIVIAKRELRQPAAGGGTGKELALRR